jgi:hypothetical protein
MGDAASLARRPREGRPVLVDLAIRPEGLPSVQAVIRTMADGFVGSAAVTRHVSMTGLAEGLDVVGYILAASVQPSHVMLAQVGN